MKRIILLTGTPLKSGLAYFHYLAFCDMPGISVEIIDNGQTTYGRTLGKRVVSRIRRQLNMAALEQYKTLLKHIGDNPDQICVILYGMACLSPIEIHRLDKMGIKLYAYFSDSPFALSPANWRAIKSILPVFRSVFVATRDIVPVYYQNGARRVSRIPFGYCRYTHYRPAAQFRQPDGKLYYFGTYGPLIEEWLAPLAKFRLVIHGHDWGRATHKELRKAAQHPVMLDAAMADLASGQLVVNFARTQHGGCHSMKTFELPSAGACMLVNRTEEQTEFFPENSCLNYFNTIPEMISLVDGFFDNSQKIAEAIKRRELYLKGQSYHERTTTMLKEMEDAFKGELRP